MSPRPYLANRFNGLPARQPIRDQAKPLKRLGSLLPANTRLKPGANESGKQTKLRSSRDSRAILELQAASDPATLRTDPKPLVMEAEPTPASREPKPRASVLRWFLLAPLVILLLFGFVIFRMVGQKVSQKLWDRSPIALLSYQIGQAETKGNLAEGVRLRRLIQVEFERVHGRDHPRSLRHLSHLATAIANQGGLAEAATLCRRALEGQERVLGPAHPDTLESLKLLATLLCDKGDWVEAEPFTERWVQSLQIKLGPEHAETKLAQDTLTSIRHKRGEREQRK